MAAYRKDENTMAKGTLIFDLPEENEEFKLAQNGSRLSCILDSIFNYLRQKRKYEDQTTVNIADLEQYIISEMKEND